MSMSFSNAAETGRPTSPMATFQYRQTLPNVFGSGQADLQEESNEPEIRFTERQFAERLAAERAAGFADAESRLRHDLEQKAELQKARITERITSFDQAQKDYFVRVEAEVVQLALAIAGKILHREAQVDPMLMAAIVHLALGQLKEGSSATIRIRPEQAQRWREHVSSLPINITVRVLEDADLEVGDCLLETELGTVNFGLDTQLKEVERGFFDVLAQKPQI